MKDFRPPKTCLACLPALAALLVVGCSSVPLEGRHTATMGAPVAAKPAHAPAAPEQLTLAERTFMSQAVSRAMYQTEVSKLAADRAIDPRVRSYAQAVAEHSSRIGN